MHTKLQFLRRTFESRQSVMEILARNVLALMLLADQYDVLHLRSKCESVILEDATLPLFDKLHLAVHLNSTALRVSSAPSLHSRAVTPIRSNV